MDKGNIRLGQLVEDFLLAKRSAGCSTKTTSWYADTLSLYLRFLEAQGLPLILRSLSADSARRYTVYLQNRRTKYEGNKIRRVSGEGLSTHTIFGYVATLGVFSGWLASEGYTDRDVLQGLPRPKKRPP